MFRFLQIKTKLFSIFSENNFMATGINQRINELAIKYFNGNNSRFAEFLQTSEANIRNYRTKTQPKVDVLNKISETLEISYEWLLTGQGTMLKSKTTTEALSKMHDEHNNFRNQENIKTCRSCIEKEKIIIELQSKLIECQERIINLINNQKL